MLENPAGPLMEILFPHDKFLHGKILPRMSVGGVLSKGIVIGLFSYDKQNSISKFWSDNSDRT